MNIQEARERYLDILLAKAQSQVELDDALLDRIERVLSAIEPNSSPVAIPEPTPLASASAYAESGPWRAVPEMLESSEPEELTKICRSCHREFTTTSKVRTQCNDCFFEADALRPEPKPHSRHKTRSPEPIDLGRARHGTAYGYDKGCGCDPCTTAHRGALRAYEARKKAREATRA